MTDLQLMKRAAEIAGKTKCWIGMGCVVARDGEVLVETYNQTLPGEKYCQEFRNRSILKMASKGSTLPGKVEPLQSPGNAGCIRHELGLSQGREIDMACSIHAEALAVARAAKSGIKIDGAAMYMTSFPCLICMRAMVASGIKKVVYMNEFYKPHHLEFFRENGVEVEQIPEEIIWS